LKGEIYSLAQLLNWAILRFDHQIYSTVPLSQSLADIKRTVRKLIYVHEALKQRSRVVAMIPRSRRDLNIFLRKSVPPEPDGKYIPEICRETSESFARMARPYKIYDA